MSLTKLHQAVFYVMWTRQGEQICAMHTRNFEEAKTYATHAIHHGGITQRIEIHDREGNLRTIYSDQWANWDKCAASKGHYVDSQGRCHNCGAPMYDHEINRSNS